MKKLTLTFLTSIVIAQGAFAQWTSSGSNIYYNTGNVGIGTSTTFPTPLYVAKAASGTTVGLFEIDGLTSAPKVVFQLGSDGTHNGAPIDVTAWGRDEGHEDMRFETSNWDGEYTWGYFSQSGGIKVVADIGTSGGGSTGQSDYGRFTLYSVTDRQGGYASGRSAGTPAISIDANPGSATYFNSGNVAIGTTNPNGYKLAVNGNAIATSFTVKTYGNWPDYVFKKSYPLLPLARLQRYIGINQHLPGMPSARDIAKNGLNLGEIDGLLTRKIEELTLYLIDKDNELKQQQLKISVNKMDVSD